MNICPTVRYNAALTLFYIGMAEAVNYVRKHVGNCLDTACKIVDDIAEKGE